MYSNSTLYFIAQILRNLVTYSHISVVLINHLDSEITRHVFIITITQNVDPITVTAEESLDSKNEPSKLDKHDQEINATNNVSGMRSTIHDNTKEKIMRKNASIEPMEVNNITIILHSHVDFNLIPY